MVEPVSLTVGAVVAALAAKAAEKAADNVAEDVVQAGSGVLGRLLARLRGRLAADGDEPGSKALARLEDASDSPARVHALAEVLDRRAAADDTFRADLEDLLSEARSGDVDVEGITQTVWGNQNVASAHVVGSQITVTYGQQPGQPSGG
jgi:hypothetical protein